MQIKNKKYAILEKILGEKIKKDVDLSEYFTLKMSTVADYVCEPATPLEWKEIVEVLYEYDIPYLIIGGGSNIAMFQESFSGVVIRNRYIHRSIEHETDTSVDMKVSSGYPMGMLIKYTIEKGYSGFEYHLGLPGTLGGALFMNSKWTRPLSYVSDNLLGATILTKKGEVRTVPYEYFEFAYDYSTLQKTGEILLDGTFRLTKCDPRILKQRSQDALLYRKETQPFGVATGGCFFQNISKEDQERLNFPTASAGYLIDRAGLKGEKRGGFEVSDIHANFIVNSGGGTTKELQSLIHHVKKTIYDKFGVTLTEEVQIV